MNGPDAERALLALGDASRHLLRAQAAVREAQEAKRAALLALRAAGVSVRDMDRVAWRHLASEFTDEEIHSLGLSYANIRLILRQARD